MTILVLDADGQPLEECLFGAAGMEGSSEYQSLVIYHHNSPSWAETVRLAIPIDKFYGSHVRFEFRHCSSKLLKFLHTEINSSWRAEYPYAVFSINVF